MCSDWTVNTNQTGARPLPDSETKALISQPLASGNQSCFKRIDQITQTINWNRFTANWQYFTSFNFRHWPFLAETLGYKDCHEVCQEDTSHIVYRWPGNSFCQDGNIPPDGWHVWGAWKVNIFNFISTYLVRALHLKGWNNRLAADSKNKGFADYIISLRPPTSLVGRDCWCCVCVVIYILDFSWKRFYILPMFKYSNNVGISIKWKFKFYSNLYNNNLFSFSPENTKQSFEHTGFICLSFVVNN